MPSTANSTDVRLPGAGAPMLESPGSVGVHTGEGGASALVTDHGSKTLATIALVLGSVSAGMLVMLALLAPLLLAAAGANAEATAREARSTAKVTEDKLYELRDALNAKGMNLPKLDGH